jgi:hypothetical protein
LTSIGGASLYETYSLAHLFKFRSILPAPRNPGHAHLRGGRYGLRRNDQL